EVPQLWNVLRGDMNVVGPRPEQPQIFAHLRTQIEHYADRQRVRPGITGWAQINHCYDRSVGDARRKVAYDLEYLARHSVLEALRSGRRALHLAAVDAGCARRAGRVHLGRTPAASLVASCFAARFVDPNSGGAARLPGSAAPARSLAARCLAIGGTPGTGAARWQRDPTPGTLLVCDRGVQRTPLADRSHRAQSPARRLGTAHRLATGVAGGDRAPRRAGAQ